MSQSRRRPISVYLETRVGVVTRRNGPGSFRKGMSIFKGNARQQQSISVATDLAASSLLEISQMNSACDSTAALLAQWDEYYAVTPEEPLHREDAEVEENFCSDFVCCGVSLPDLHALLQHYEESHVKMEDCMESDSNLYSSYSYSNSNSNSHPHPHSYSSSSSHLHLHSTSSNPQYHQHYHHSSYGGSNFGYSGGGYNYNNNGSNSYYTITKKKIVAVGIEQQDSTSDTPSAFDTTVFRTISPGHYQHSLYGNYIPKRPRSAPVTSLTSDQNAINTLRAMLPPAFANAPADNSLQLIHSALSSTLNPPKTSNSKKNGRSSNESGGGSEEDDGSSTNGGNGSTSARGGGRPYICQVSGCGKTYKNPNGLKYHSLHGHDRDGKDTVEKPHRCPFSNCAKRYKNPNGLKYHIQHGHPGQTPPGKRTTTIASLRSIAGLDQIEAAIRREQALRAQLAAQSILRPYP